MAFVVNGLVVMVKNSTFAAKNKTMTQKEAIIEALKRLGGKAVLDDIYRLAYKLADFSGSRDYKATIRWYLQKETDSFRSSGRGTWELLSYQEEIASRDRRIAELEAQLSDKDHIISEMMKRETVSSFVKRLVDGAKTIFATKRNDARPVQQVLVVLDRQEQQELMEWIIEKPTKTANKSVTKKIIHQTINNGNTFVDHQTVIPNVGNYQPQIKTQNMNIPLSPTEEQEQRLIANE